MAKVVSNSQRPLMNSFSSRDLEMIERNQHSTSDLEMIELNQFAATGSRLNSKRMISRDPSFFTDPNSEPEPLSSLDLDAPEGKHPDILDYTAHTKRAPAEPAAAPGTLGTVGGVLIPVLLNIWGVMLFLRLGWVMGQAGLIQGTLVITLSNVVTLVTTLSMCAICTNGTVKGGGAYFLISRSLGPAFGGSIGLLFFIAQAFAASMYVIGFCETLIGIFRTTGFTITGAWDMDQRIYGVITMVVLLCMALIGIGWLIKCQMALLAVLLVCIVAVVAGSAMPQLPDVAANAAAGFVGFSGYSGGTNSTLGDLTWVNGLNWGPSYAFDPVTGVTHSFFTVFSVFFPAVTGIMAGANMSGDLANPSVAIPRGTLWGIAITYVSYVGIAWIIALVAKRCVGQGCAAAFAGTASAADVANLGGLLWNKQIMQNLSMWAPLVIVGVFAATLSSAVASIAGAPRILQAVSADKVFPFAAINYFGKGEGPDNEPRRGYFLTFFIACGCIMIGQLDLIAPLISNFFLISYALVNWACFTVSHSKAPGWRPTFRYYNKWLSLMGAILCVAVMFLMNWYYTLASLAICCVIYMYLVNNPPPGVDWGEASQAMKYSRAITALVEMQSLGDHVKNYRPHLLLLSGPVEQRAALVRFANFFAKGRGLFICGHIISRTAEATALAAERVRRAGSAMAAAQQQQQQTQQQRLLSLPETKEAAEASEDAETAEAAEAAEVAVVVTQGEEGEGGTDDEASDEETATVTTQPQPQPQPQQPQHTGLSGLYWDDSVSAAAGGDAGADAESLAGTARAIAAALAERGSGGALAESMLMDPELATTLGEVTMDPDFGVRTNSVAEVAVAQNRDLHWLRHNSVPAFADVVSATSFRRGVRRFMQLSGLGKLKPNVFVLGFKADWKEREGGEQPAASARGTNAYYDVIRDIIANNYGLMVVRRPERVALLDATVGGTIDVWWLVADGGLSVLLPFLMSRHRSWRGCTLRVFSMNLASLGPNAAEAERAEARADRKSKLEGYLNAARIKPEIHIVDARLNAEVPDDMRAKFEASGVQVDEDATRSIQLALKVREKSRGAKCCFINLPIPKLGVGARQYLAQLDVLSDMDCTTCLIRGNSTEVISADI